MRNFVLAISILFIIVGCKQPTSNDVDTTNMTTYYFIRHAEKDRSDKNNPNPSLTIQGQRRAQKWAHIFSEITFDAVYSSNYNRTMETALPTAVQQKLELNIYDASKLYTQEFQTETLGKTVLVVGHSNTTPAFANKVLDKDLYTNFDDSDNGSLIIVTINNNTKSSTLLHL